MTRKVSLVFLSLACFCFEPFAFAPSVRQDILVGSVAYFGNEPFVKMGIRTDDGKTYSIKADDALLASLKQEFGKRLKFYGKIHPLGEGMAGGVTNAGSFELDSFVLAE